MTTFVKADLTGNWSVERIDGRSVVEPGATFIQFTENDRVAGRSGCNRFTGSYALSGVHLTFSETASTRMICPNPLMEQEKRFLAALARVALVNMENGRLRLKDAQGNVVLQASRPKTPD